MKYIFPILVLVALVTAFAVEPIKINAPSATGMHSNVDREDLRLTDATLLQNADVVSNPGVLRRRAGHIKYGTNAQAVTAVASLYDPITKWKAAVGVMSIDTIRVTGFHQPDLTEIDSVLTCTTSAGEASLGVFVHTANYGSALTTVIQNWWVQYDTDHDFTTSDVGLIHAATGSPPAIISLRDPAPAVDTILDTIKTITDSIDVDTIYTAEKEGSRVFYDTIYDTLYLSTSTDTVYTYIALSDSVVFSPSCHPLSPEQPGALRVFAINNVGGKLDGLYQYAVTFKAPNTNGPNSGMAHSARGPGSAIIRVTDGKAILTSFPYETGKNYSWIDSTYAVIWRRRVDKLDSYHPIDSIRYVDSSTSIVYVDNILTVGADPTTANYDDLAMEEPGQPNPIVRVADPHPEYNSWNYNEFYWVGCSYVDTILGTESPIGWLTKVRTTDTTAATPGLVYALALQQGYSGGHRALRVYQSVAADAVLGADDSTVLYALYDFVLQDNGGVEFISVGRMSDTALANIGGILDEDGLTMIRPPYIEGLAATFTDMEEMAGRMWGAGDPEFPSRLYYSEYDAYYDWPTFNYLDLDEDDNDIIVAIEKIKIGVDEGLIAFKRRKIFGIFGYDPEYDLSLQLLADGCGAVGRKNVLQHEGVIYFVNNSLDVCRIRGGEIDTISLSNRSQIINILTDTNVTRGNYGSSMSWVDSYSAKDINARMMAHDKEVLLVNQYTAEGMAWNTTSNIWSKVRYFGTASTRIPRGTFVYDTMSTVDLFGEKRHLMYFKDTDTCFFVTSDTSTWDDPTGGVYDGIHFLYHTPEFGDGEDYWEISQVQFTFSGTENSDDTLPNFQFRIIDNNFDTLATSTFKPLTSTPTDYTIGFTRHAGKTLSVEFAASPVGGEVNIHNMVVYLRRIGRNRTL